MAIPRKGSRCIVVDGVEYRWRVRHKPTYSQGNGWTPLTFAVELADPTGATLLVQTVHDHAGSWMLVGSPAAVRPRDVEEAVRSALVNGWVPSRPGPTFVLDQRDSTTS